MIVSISARVRSVNLTATLSSGDLADFLRAVDKHLQALPEKDWPEECQKVYSVLNDLCKLSETSIF